MSSGKDKINMTSQAQALVFGEIDQQGSVDGGLDADATSSDIDEEQHYRASAYALIAALLRVTPDQQMLDRLGGLPSKESTDGDELLLAMSTLSLSAKLHTPASIDEEFHDLFIGFGKGEVVPYGSWYLTGFLMEKPLSDLRDDLARLGYERNVSVTEPEDHAAALCEVISLMIAENVDLAMQKQFFESHMTSWMSRFFTDLSEAKSAIFYRAVGRFGAAFIAFENEYFSMQT